jgi:uncharacterized surface protein with fasciclin (FAS1) repeats
MKNPAILIGSIILLFSSYSCQRPDVVANFKDMRQMTIYDYLNANKDKYSSFLAILQSGKLDKTLEAYNPHGTGYTLFLPDNNAIDNFIKNSNKYSSLSDLLKDSAYDYELCRYHVVNLAIKTNDFPFGALPDLTLSLDYLTVSFVVEPDTSYYLINNQARITKANIELSNGYIHVIADALNPVTYTSYGWLANHPGYSIFKAAVDITGLKDTININNKDLTKTNLPFTMLIEADSVYNRSGIFSLEDLEKLISPGNDNYTNKLNPLYNFVAYHILTGTRFLDNLFNVSTNYTTYSDVPLSINGIGIDIKINPGKENFDTIINQSDTTIINWVGFYYDVSNIVTQSGAIHFINHVLKQQIPSRFTQTYEFWEEPLLNQYRLVPGTYLIEDHSSLSVVSWYGADLNYVKLADIPGVNAIAWSNDYLLINGDFTLSYTIPAVVQGSYTVFLQADAANSTNALIEVYIDGVKLGRLVDLTSGGTAGSPFIAIQLGTIQFIRYEPHTIEVRSLIPGRFCWDYIQFQPA